MPPHTVPVREKNWEIYVSKVIWENMVQFCHGKLNLTAGPFFTGKSADFCSRMQFWAASSSFFAAPDGQGRCPTLTQEKKTHPPLTLLLFWKVPSRPSLIWQSEEVLLIGTAKSNCDWNWWVWLKGKMVQLNLDQKILCGKERQVSLVSFCRISILRQWIWQNLHRGGEYVSLFTLMPSDLLHCSVLRHHHIRLFANAN